MTRTAIITEARFLPLVSRPADRDPLAYCTLVLWGSIVIREVKILDGTKGLIVSMPADPAKDRCPNCHERNSVKANFCGQCGRGLPTKRDIRINAKGRPILYYDLVHPVDCQVRRRLESEVIEAYRTEEQWSQMPDYRQGHLRYDPVSGDWLRYLPSAMERRAAC